MIKVVTRNNIITYLGSDKKVDVLDSELKPILAKTANHPIEDCYTLEYFKYVDYPRYQKNHYWSQRISNKNLLLISNGFKQAEIEFDKLVYSYIYNSKDDYLIVNDKYGVSWEIHIPTNTIRKLEDYVVYPLPLYLG